MAVTVNKKGGAKAAAAKEDNVRLELKLCENYDFGGYTYRKGVVYSFTRERAEYMLGPDHIDKWDRPYFARYQPKGSERVMVIGPKQIDMATVVPAKSTLPPKPAKPTILELGSDDELLETVGEEAAAELGLGENEVGEEIG